MTVVTTGGGGGTAVTVTFDVPFFPALVAVMVAKPAATPVTTPFEFTVAAAASLVDQVTVWPVMTFPWASFTVADSDAVAPTAIEAVAGDTVTVVTTGGGGGTAVTVTLDIPLFPALVAVMVTDPAANPVTRPLELTAAADPSLVDHATGLPAMTLPCASFTVAESEVVVPTTIDTVDGATVTVDTASRGVGVGSVVVPPPEHTESTGTRRSHD